MPEPMPTAVIWECAEPDCDYRINRGGTIGAFDDRAIERMIPAHNAEKHAQLVKLPVREATMIRRGDHLIVRIDSDLTFDDAARIRQELRERLPLLSDVTVVNAAQLYVLRNEAVDRG